MNRPLTAAAAMFVFWPALLSAQDRTATTSTPLSDQALSAAPTLLQIAPRDRVSAVQGAQAPAPLQRRRRPSMVGYIEDATVTSQVRFRFDAGFGNDTPDRAEFFYAKCGCYHFQPAPFGDLDAPGPGPGVPTELNFQQYYAQAEFAAQDRFSVFAELPIRAIQPQDFLPFGPPFNPFPNQTGLGDIRAGAKVSLLADELRGVTFQLRAGLPTGDASKGLSTDTFNLEPAILYNQQLSDRVGLEAQFGSWHPFGGSDGVNSPDKFSGNILYYGIGPSFDVVNTGRVRFAPVVELTGWRVIGGFQTSCDASGACSFDTDDNIVNLKFGARTFVDDRNSLYVGYGMALTSAEWYDQILRVEYRRGF
jgi:hypothetical protein